MSIINESDNIGLSLNPVTRLRVLPQPTGLDITLMPWLKI